MSADIDDRKYRTAPYLGGLHASFSLHFLLGAAGLKAGGAERVTDVLLRSGIEECSIVSFAMQLEPENFVQISMHMSP